MVVNTTPQVRFDRRIVIANSPMTDRIAAMSLGIRKAGGALQLSLLEAHFLISKNQLIVTDAKGKALSIDAFERRADKIEPAFWVRAAVFTDLRTRGYVVKTGLKYGADFSVYERGIKPGQDHAKWVVFPVHEGDALRWHEFSGKNRVAHTTKKRLLLGIVDDDASVLYYEVNWTRP